MFVTKFAINAVFLPIIFISIFNFRSEFMTSTNLQVKLFEQLKTQLPTHQKLVYLVMEQLQLTRSQAYRRINGTVPVSLDELKVLAEKFELSIDDILLEPNDAQIRFSASLRMNESYLGFLQQLHQTLLHVRQMKEVQVQYATNEFPIFYTFMFPDLVRFKLYMWNRTFWKNGHKQGPFTLSVANPDELAIADAIQKEYLSIATTEYWHIRMFDNTLSQIHYALESGFFKNSTDAELLIGHLYKGLQHVASMAEYGYKRLIGDAPSTQRAAFQLYLSDLPTNVHFLVTQEDRRQLFSTFDNPNFMHTRNKAICDYSARWFENLQNKSILISQSGDKARNQFFHRMEKDIAMITEDL